MYDVEKLLAGKETDALVAQHVMHWGLYKFDEISQYTAHPELKREHHTIVDWSDLDLGRLIICPLFSKDMGRAWEAMEHVYRSTGHVKVRMMAWASYAAAGWEYPYGCQVGEGQVVICGPSAPLAICRGLLVHAGVAEITESAASR